MIGGRQGVGDAQVWIAVGPVDMRKSFDGLAEVVRSFLGHDPLSGSMFVFRNKSSQRVKILWWDRDGLAIYYKRLERGTFRFPTGTQNSSPWMVLSCYACSTAWNSWPGGPADFSGSALALFGGVWYIGPHGPHRRTPR